MNPAMDKVVWTEIITWEKYSIILNKKIDFTFVFVFI